VIGNGQQPQVVQPAPLPTTIQVARVLGADGTPFVLLTFLTPQGQACFFVDLEVAKQVASALSQAGGGIVLPPAGPP
jgi:hypothetical protein